MFLNEYTHSRCFQNGLQLHLLLFGFMANMPDWNLYIPFLNQKENQKSTILLQYFRIQTWQAVRRYHRKGDLNVPQNNWVLQVCLCQTKWTGRRTVFKHIKCKSKKRNSHRTTFNQHFGCILVTRQTSPYFTFYLGGVLVLCCIIQISRFSFILCLITGFPPALEYLEKWDNFFQSGKSQGILKKYQKVREF